MSSWEKCNHDNYKIEADFSADPIWCAKCSWNFDLDDFPLSEGLKKELIRWVLAFEKVVDLHGDCLKDTAFYQRVKNHNDWGEILTARVREELGDGYPIVFKPYH